LFPKKSDMKGIIYEAFIVYQLITQNKTLFITTNMKIRNISLLAISLNTLSAATYTETVRTGAFSTFPTGRVVNVDVNNDGNNDFAFQLDYTTTASASVTTSGNAWRLDESGDTLSVDLTSITYLSDISGDFTFNSVSFDSLWTAIDVFSAGVDVDVNGTNFNTAAAGTLDISSAAISSGSTLTLTGTDGQSYLVERLLTPITIDFSPVPEPTATALLGLGSLALLIRRKR